MLETVATLEVIETVQALEGEPVLVEPVLVEEDLLVEDVSIDGMCGVY